MLVVLCIQIGRAWQAVHAARVRVEWLDHHSHTSFSSLMQRACFRVRCEANDEKVRLTEQCSPLFTCFGFAYGTNTSL